MNVLSLFDGMSCAQIALRRLNIPITNYYASEIDKHAIKVAMANFPSTIQLGDVRNISAKSLPKIDFICAGSPCQGFSFAGKQLAFDDPRSKLFFEFVRILNEVREVNPDVIFFLENVKMKREHELVITQYMDVSPLTINSALVSAQNRVRLYWTNIKQETQGLFKEKYCAVPQPKDKGIYLKDILEEEVDEKYYLSDKMLAFLKSHSAKMTLAGNGFRFSPKTENDKASTVTQRCYKMGVDDNYIIQRPHGYNQRGVFAGKAPSITSSAWRENNFLIQREPEYRIRKITPIECERLQTVPDNYTASASNTQRYRMLGNGWNVDTICHILSYANFPK